MKLQTINYDGDMAYYVKGHVTYEEFLKAWVDYHGDYEAPPPEAKPRYECKRKVPCNTGDYQCWVDDAKEGSRGSFKVTIYNPVKDYIEDKYKVLSSSNMAG